MVKIIIKDGKLVNADTNETVEAISGKLTDIVTFRADGDNVARDRLRFHFKDASGEDVRLSVAKYGPVSRKLIFILLGRTGSIPFDVFNVSLRERPAEVPETDTGAEEAESGQEADSAAGAAEAAPAQRRPSVLTVTAGDLTLRPTTRGAMLIEDPSLNAIREQIFIDQSVSLIKSAIAAKFPLLVIEPGPGDGWDGLPDVAEDILEDILTVKAHCTMEVKNFATLGERTAWLEGAGEQRLSNAFHTTNIYDIEHLSSAWESVDDEE